MSDLMFVHLTDLHLTDTPGQLTGDESGAEYSNPDRYLTRVITEIRSISPSPAFIVISGDLVNNPSVPAYLRVKATVAELQGIAPVFLALGNHDDRALFRQIVLDAAGDSTAPYHYATTIDGLRLIVLDSTVPGEVRGEIGPTQLAWLANQLRQPAPGGTLVVLHHAVVDVFAVPNSVFQGEWGLTDAGELEEVIAAGEVLGLLTGHVHVNSIARFGGTIAASLTSMVAAMNPTQVGGTFKPGAGFNVCAVRAGRLIVNSVAVA